MNKTRSFATCISTLLVTLASAGIASAQTWSGTLNGTTEAWNNNANWTPATFPNAIDAVAILTGDWTANKSIQLNQGITVGSLSLGDTSGTSTLSVATGTGTNTLTFDVTSGSASLSSIGGTDTISTAVTLADNLDIAATSAMTLSGNIGETGGARSITKTNVAGAMTLSGNNSFSGGIVNRRGTINMGGSSNNVIGSGTFTFANQAGGAGNTLSLNRNVTTTLANNFVQDNAATVSGTEYAAITFAGGNSSHRTLTLNGTFSTGANFLTNGQSLFLNANGTQTGLGEGTMILNGDWAAYNAGATNTNAVRANEGSILIGAQQSIAPTGTYRVQGNSTAVASKLILNGAFTMANELRFDGAANGQLNSFGSRNAAATTATLSGNTLATDTDGANFFSQNSGAILAISGQLQNNSPIRINNPYTYTTGDAANSLQTPVGTVNLTRAAGNSITGGFTVVGGTLLASNTSGSATGTGAVTVGIVSGSISGQTGTTAATTRVITGFTTATAQGLQIGQSITGTNIPAGSIITGIALGSGAANSVIVIDKTTTVAGTPTDLAFGAFTSTGTLGGTGRIAPSGANGLTVNSGSAINFVDGATNGLDVEFLGTGSASFTSGATFKMELNAPGVSDVIDFAGLADASTVVFNSNVIDFTNLGGLAAGTYTLFTFDNAGDYAGTLAIGTGLEAFLGSSLVYNASNIQLLVAVPEPSAAISLLGGLGLLLGLRRRRN